MISLNSTVHPLHALCTIFFKMLVIVIDSKVSLIYFSDLTRFRKRGIDQNF